VQLTKCWTTYRYVYLYYSTKSSSVDPFSTPDRKGNRTPLTNDHPADDGSKDGSNYESPDEYSLDTSDYSVESNGQDSLDKDDMSRDNSDDEEVISVDSNR
jgi:hypothetical protein